MEGTIAATPAWKNDMVEYEGCGADEKAIAAAEVEAPSPAYSSSLLYVAWAEFILSIARSKPPRGVFCRDQAIIIRSESRADVAFIIVFLHKSGVIMAIYASDFTEWIERGCAVWMKLNCGGLARGVHDRRVMR